MKPASNARRTLSGLLAMILALTGPVAAVAQEQTAAAEGDPWEGYNRAIFSFNEGFDKYLLKPVTKGYVAVVPEYGRERVHNVLNNLHMPIVFINSVLQGDGGNAMSSLWSFILNSTFGVLGIFDFAGSNTDLVVHDEDFGQTLGVWGVGTGPYFVLPLLGPSTVRDTAGVGVDWVSDPYNYLVSDELIITRVAFRAIDQRAGLLKPLDDIYATSIDPYATIRSGYLQRRAAMVANRGGSQATSALGMGGGAQGVGADVDPAADQDPAALADQ